jgi:probable rRNA maturation factor
MSAEHSVDIEISERSWGDVKQPALRAAFAALDVVHNEPHSAEISVRLADDEEVRHLNREYRGQDKSTNVLSFAADIPDIPWPADQPYPLGDIILAYGTVRDEALAQGKSLENHLCHLIVHGVLHLSGYDHEDDETAKDMETLEIKILTRLGIEDPYML